MKHIFFVEDDLSLINGLSFALKKQGYGLDTARTVKEGRQLWKEKRYDLIILDVMMPDVDGYTVAKRVRENSSTKDIPILMLTALSQLNDKVNGFNIGVDDYLVKPFEMQELEVRVRALLKRTNQIPKSAKSTKLPSMNG